MTFDQCPECNQPVSSNKRTCNHCGYPLKGELIPFLYHNMRFSFIVFSLVVITIAIVSFRFSPEYDAFINSNSTPSRKGWLTSLLTLSANESKQTKNQPSLSSQNAPQNQNLTIEVNGVGISVNLTSIKEKIKKHKAKKQEDTQQQTDN